jgi:hypothetical protein
MCCLLNRNVYSSTAATTASLKTEAYAYGWYNNTSLSLLQKQRRSRRKQVKSLKMGTMLLVNFSVALSSRAACSQFQVCFQFHFSFKGSTSPGSPSAVRLRCCPKCRAVEYCGAACQAADWTIGGHRLECRGLQVMPNASVLSVFNYCATRANYAACCFLTLIGWLSAGCRAK